MIARLLAFLFGSACVHDWHVSEVKGGTVGLLYADRHCPKCGRLETRNSRWEWVDHFQPSSDWELKDKITGKPFIRQQNEQHQPTNPRRRKQ